MTSLFFVFEEGKGKKKTLAYEITTIT